MANVCSDYNVRGCPASYYLNCSAYLSGVNCWEVRERPCCNKQGSHACTGCQVYQAALARVRAESEDG